MTDTTRYSDEEICDTAAAGMRGHFWDKRYAGMINQLLADNAALQSKWQNAERIAQEQFEITRQLGRELEQVKAERDIMKEALEEINTQPYPLSVFPEITERQWECLQIWCSNQGFPIDRLSAAYGRLLRKTDIEIAQKALTTQARPAEEA